MKKKVLFILMVLCLGISFFAAAETNVPGDTTADEILKKDIAANIDMFQQAAAPGYEYKITDTKVKSINKDKGLLVTLEEWTVMIGDKRIVYEVRFDQNPNGGTDFTVTAPPKDFYDSILKK